MTMITNFKAMLKRCRQCLNAFLNSGGGTLYFGIDNNGIIQGVNLSYTTRDKWRTGISGVINSFEPRIDSSYFDVRFTQIHQQRKDPLLIEPLLDTFVVEITIQKGYSAVHFTNHQRDIAYFRSHGCTMIMDQNIITHRLGSTTVVEAINLLKMPCPVGDSSCTDWIYSSEWRSLVEASLTSDLMNCMHCLNEFVNKYHMVTFDVIELHLRIVPGSRCWLFAERPSYSRRLSSCITIGPLGDSRKYKLGVSTKILRHEAALDFDPECYDVTTNLIRLKSAGFSILGSKPLNNVFELTLNGIINGSIKTNDGTASACVLNEKSHVTQEYLKNYFRDHRMELYNFNQKQVAIRTSKLEIIPARNLSAADRVLFDGYNMDGFLFIRTVNSTGIEPFMIFEDTLEENSLNRAPLPSHNKDEFTVSKNHPENVDIPVYGTTVKDAQLRPIRQYIKQKKKIMHGERAPNLCFVCCPLLCCLGHCWIVYYFIWYILFGSLALIFIVTVCCS